MKLKEKWLRGTICCVLQGGKGLILSSCTRRVKKHSRPHSEGIPYSPYITTHPPFEKHHHSYDSKNITFTQPNPSPTHQPTNSIFTKPKALGLCQLGPGAFQQALQLSTTHKTITVLIQAIKATPEQLGRQQISTSEKWSRKTTTWLDKWPMGRKGAGFFKVHEFMY